MLARAASAVTSGRFSVVRSTNGFCMAARVPSVTLLALCISDFTSSRYGRSPYGICVAQNEKKMLQKQGQPCQYDTWYQDGIEWQLPCKRKPSCIASPQHATMKQHSMQQKAPGYHVTAYDAASHRRSNTILGRTFCLRDICPVERKGPTRRPFKGRPCRGCGSSSAFVMASSRLPMSTDTLASASGRLRAWLGCHEGPAGRYQDAKYKKMIRTSQKARDDR